MTYLTFSLGCKVNSYECAAVAALLVKEGYKEDKVNPDIIIINTCSVTHVADQKSRQHVRSFRKRYPSSIIVVMGCSAQEYGDYLLNECHADIVIGTSLRNKIPLLIKEYLSTHKPILLINKYDKKPCYEELGVFSYGENIRAYLKIQDGCNNFCTYCIVPFRRGLSRSRDFANVLLEANNLIKEGYKEIVISGIHIGLYGKDNGHSLSELIEEILKIPDLYQLRISSIEESEIDDKLINLLINNDKLAKHLHIPLQSGSDTVLKRMGRKYDKASFLVKMKYLRNKLPDICFTTDVIVGFPEESDEEFLETYNFIKEVGFNELHVFPYSKREGTVAARNPHQVDEKIKKERCNKLLALSNELKKEYEMKFINKEVEVLVEQFDKLNKYNIGHTSNYLEVKIFNESSLVGEIKKTIFKNND